MSTLDGTHGWVPCPLRFWVGRPGTGTRDGTRNMYHAASHGRGLPTPPQRTPGFDVARSEPTTTVPRRRSRGRSRGSLYRRQNWVSNFALYASDSLLTSDLGHCHRYRMHMKLFDQDVPFESFVLAFDTRPRTHDDRRF